MADSQGGGRGGHDEARGRRRCRGARGGRQGGSMAGGRRGSLIAGARDIWCGNVNKDVDVGEAVNTQSSSEDQDMKQVCQDRMLGSGHAMKRISAPEPVTTTPFLYLCFTAGIHASSSSQPTFLYGGAPLENLTCGMCGW